MNGITTNGHHKHNAEEENIIPIDKELNDELLDCYLGEATGWYWCGPKKYLMTSPFISIYDKYFNFQTRSDDIWIVTFPRSGTTVTQELVWLLTHNLDYGTAKKLNVWERSPFFEFEMLFHPENKRKMLNENIDNEVNQQIIHAMSEPSLNILNTMDSPRVIKTHFPISMLPKDIKQTNPKKIYVARNATDVTLSFYHLIRLWRTSDYTSNFEQFVEQFKRGLVLWGPYWEHVQEGWENRHDDKVLFLFYEDMVKDMKATIKTMAKFLEVNISEKEIDILAEHVDIKNFKNNPAVNFEHLRDVGILNKKEESFIRQGSSRGSGSEFTQDILETFNKWIEENVEKRNIQFPAKQ